MERRGSGCTSPMSRPTCPEGSRDRSRGETASDQRLRSGRGRADAPACALQRSLLAGPGSAARGGHGRDGAGRGAASPDAFYRSLIRSDERLDYERVDRIFAGVRARESPGASRSRLPAGWRWRCSARRERAGRSRSTLRAGLRLRRRGQRDRDPRTGADRVPPADRAPDDRRQRSGRRDAAVSAAVPCLYRVHERPDSRSGWSAWSISWHRWR